MPSDLHTSPRCRADQLGLPMPADPHAVSVCLPLWEHNIGYEEGDAAVLEKLQAAYPRFAFHPLVRQLCDRSLNSGDRAGLPFVSRATARRAIEYVRYGGCESAELRTFEGQAACGVVVPRAELGLLKQYWQHAGENVSSRVAEQMLNNERATCSETPARLNVRRRVADLHDVSVEDVFLHPSGMAAIASSWRTVQAWRQGSTCQFGFPYVDTLKIQQRFPGASHHFFKVGNRDDIRRLKELCKVSPPVAVFCEVPTNPLLITPDVDQLRSMADEFDFLLVIDDTLGACGNIRALPFADIVVTSLTKYFSGYGNVLAGGLVLNQHRRHAAELKAILSAAHEETLSDVDTEILDRNSADMHDRVSIINSNAASLASLFRSHSAVASVYYPDADDEGYELLRTPDGGYGGLLSIVLKDPAITTPETFDRLEICKGPNLGTNFTLCCPYTILAHYDELDFVETCGVSRWLLRISVGTEPIEELTDRFVRALPGGINCG